MPVQLTIDERRVTTTCEATILQAAEALGIEIPTLCHHPSLAPAGSCRLCLVEVDGGSHLHAACATRVVEGMTVRTTSPAIVAQRRLILQMLLIDYQDKEESYERRETEFDRWCREYGASRPSDAPATLRYVRDSDPSPFIRVDLNKCILCTRCIRACSDVQGRFVWGLSDRGNKTQLIAGSGTTMLEARCESCGACSAVCPAGALEDRLSLGSGVPDRLVRTTCTYCGVGCQFDLNVHEDRVVRVTSALDAPVNGLSLCVKGRYGFDFIHHSQRLTRPQVREYLLHDPLASRQSGAPRGEWIPVSWDQALDLVADRLTHIHQVAGSNSLGFLSSAKCSNEENYLMQKLARQIFGTNNIDHCARLCHSSTVTGLTMAYGSGAMSNSMDDICQYAQGLFIIGSNTTEQHPVFGAKIRQAVRDRGVKLVVADPRRVDIAELATIHLRHRPGSDIPLLNGLMHLILRNGWEDRQFIEQRCEGFEAVRESLLDHQYAPTAVSGLTGVPTAQLESAAELLAKSKPMAAIWAMGITQHTSGVLNVLALANLQMLLGNIGIPGGGVNPLRGQNNVQGACDMGALPNMFPGYRTVCDSNANLSLSAAWRLASSAVLATQGSLNASGGLTVTEMIDAAGHGAIRGLYLLAENPVLTDPDSNRVRDSLTRAEFVVLQEIFPSETSQYADVLLPGVSFAERTGTFTNTERRVQIFQQSIEPVGDSRPDWMIISDLARRILVRQSRSPSGPQAGWDYTSPHEILREAASLTPIYSGVNYERLHCGERLQWPVSWPEHPGTPILHINHFSRGKGRFHCVSYLPPQEVPDAEYPLLLTTGRVLYHWHGGEMTRRARGLAAAFPQNFVEVSPVDANILGIAQGEAITLHSRRGTMQAFALVTDRIAPGVVFGNFHFPAEANVNNLTIAALDPIAKIPEYKVCAVRIEKSGI